MELNRQTHSPSDIFYLTGVANTVALGAVLRSAMPARETESGACGGGNRTTRLKWKKFLRKERVKEEIQEKQWSNRIQLRKTTVDYTGIN